MNSVFHAGRLAWPRSRFFKGFIVGILAFMLVRWTINVSTVPDWLVAPLLVPDSLSEADVIVAMGAGVIGDCVPNQNGVRRALLAAKMWREKRAPVILFTGGAADGSCPVSAAMARLARDVGVDDESIVMETVSRTTYENGVNSAPLLKARGVRRLLVVTDRLHMRRAAGVFTRLGFDVSQMSVPVYAGHADNVSMLSAGARELAALAVYRWRGWVQDPAVDREPDGTIRTSAQTALVATGKHMPLAVRNPQGPIIVLGASYAGGWKPTSIGHANVVTTGVSGQQSFEMLERFERDVVAAKPRAVIIWGFINDFFRSAPVDADAVRSRIQASYARMIDASLVNGIEPIVVTEVTLRGKDSIFERLASWAGWVVGKQGYQDRINGYVVSTNRLLVASAREQGLLVLDFERVLADPGGRRRREFAADDGSHISAAGYAALSSYALPVLEEHFASSPKDR